MTQALDQMQRRTDDIPRQVTVLSLQLVGQHKASRKAEESTRDIEPNAYVVVPETNGFIRGKFACVKEVGEIMIITGSSMMEWTREIITRRRRTVMEEESSQRARHFEEFSRSVNNFSLQEQTSVSTYQQPSPSEFGLNETPRYTNIIKEIRKYTENAKNMDRR